MHQAISPYRAGEAVPLVDKNCVCGSVGFRHVRLRSNTGEVLVNSTLFVHVAVTNRKGGGVSRRLCSSHFMFFTFHVMLSAIHS